MKQLIFDITTDSSGAYTGTRVVAFPELLYAVEWVDTNFDAGVDAVLSVTSTPSGEDVTLITLTNADAEKWYYPRHDEHDSSGTALTTDTLPVVNGTLKVVVSNGGNAKTGKVICYLVEV